MSHIGRILSYLSNSLAAIAGCAIVLMILHITLDVFMRSAFNQPISGTILFVAKMYMPIIAFLPLALTERIGGHVSVELLFEHLPAWLQRVLTFLSHLLSVVVFWVLAYRAWSEATAKYSIGASEMEGGLRIPIWPSYFILPISAALIMALLVYKIARLASGGDDTDFGGPAMPHDVLEEIHSV